MDNKEKSPEQELIESIGLMIEKGMESNTNIYTGVVKSVDGKRAVVAVNGQNQNVSIATADVSSGNVVRVFVPKGNMSAAFIIKAEASGGGGTTTTAYGDLTGKPQINGVTLVDNKTSKELNLYGTGNEPPYPVTSVNGQTGDITIATGGNVDSVNGKTGVVVLSATDVGALPNTTVIPDKTSQLDNDSGYITNSALTDYAKKTEIPTKTSELTNDSGYITNVALEPYAKTVDIPTKTSQLNNDSGYITANDVPVKSVDGATGDVVTNAVKTTTQTLTDAQKQQARTNIGAGTSSFDGDYNSLTNKPTIPTKTSQLDNDSGFITDIPIASSTQLGGVKIGAGLSVTANGVLSATGGGTADAVEWNNVLDKPTTIAGYGITDAKIENGTIILGNKTITPLTSAPVTSVNSKTGAVVLGASDVGAISTGNISQTLGTSTTKVPSEKAVSNALSSAGFGDMLKSTYDPTGSVATAGGIPDYVANNAPVTSVNGATGDVKSTFYVAVTEDKNGSVTADKTPEVVYAAYTAGYAVYAFVNSYSYYPAVLPMSICLKESGQVLLVFTVLTGSRSFMTVDYNGSAWSITTGTLANSDDIPTIPEYLPNPNALNIKIGNTTTSYDGSAAKTVEIPEGVPSVTTSDNGKFLRVVNGAWAAVTIADANGVKF